MRRAVERHSRLISCAAIWIKRTAAALTARSRRIQLGHAGPLRRDLGAACLHCQHESGKTNERVEAV